MPKHHNVSIPPKWDWERDIPPAPGIRAGNTLYLSGQIALGPHGDIVGSTITEQAHRCFQNIQDILARAGGRMTDIVKMTTYFTVDITQGVAQEYWQVRQQYFGDYRPASTGVRVAQLLFPTCLLEIEAVAVLPAMRRKPARSRPPKPPARAAAKRAPRKRR